MYLTFTFLPSRQDLNMIVGNAKRFLAYEIIKRLEEAKKEDLLHDLYQAVKQRERKKGQRHRCLRKVSIRNNVLLRNSLNKNWVISIIIQLKGNGT